MKRRVVLLGGAAALVWRPLANAQRPRHAYRVGYVMGGTPEHEDSRRFLKQFRDGMTDLGYQEGKNLVLAVRYYGSDRSKIAALADELVAWQADVLVANVSSTAAVLKQKTATIPIVMATAVDPVGEGLVTSLARPGGNVTGMTSLSEAVHAKLVELAHELFPHATRIALLVNPSHTLARSNAEVATQAAKTRGLDISTLQLSRASEIEQFGERLSRVRPDALIIVADAVLFFLREPILQAALRAGVPAIAVLPEFAASGALASYGHDITVNFRRAAGYVDRVLKGANPGELPIEQPTQFQLVLNLKTARALGVTIPQPVLVRADKVIE
jgi:putative ABC transport system substrate-binding protein